MRRAGLFMPEGAVVMQGWPWGVGERPHTAPHSPLHHHGLGVRCNQAFRLPGCGAGIGDVSSAQSTSVLGG